MKKSANPPPPRNPVVSSASTVPPVLPTDEQSSDEQPNQNELLANENNRLNNRITSLEDLVRSLTASITNSNQGSTSSSSTASSTSIPLNAVVNVAVDLTVESRSVLRKNYNNTSASVSAMFLSNRIKSTTKDSFTKISMIRGALSTAGLKNLLDGHRKKPVVTATNTFGYSDRVIKTVRIIDEITGIGADVEIMLDEDDRFCYAYDCGRLYQAVLEIFGRSLLYLVPREIEDNDGQQIYVKIMAHLNGQRARDADVARENFLTYVMNENITFKMEHSQFSEIFKTLEYAQRRDLTNDEKMSFLSRRLMRDSRLGLKDVMVQASINDYTYEKTIELLIKINSDMADSDQTVKLANIYQAKNNNYNNKTSNNIYVNNKNNATPTKYCYSWNETGACRFGSSCKYTHKNDPNHVQREKRNKNENENNNSNENSSTPITTTYRTSAQESVGPPKGKGQYKGKHYKNQINSMNTAEENASIKQISVINQNESYISSSPSDFQSWGNKSLAPYVPSKQITSDITLKSMKCNHSIHVSPESPLFIPPVNRTRALRQRSVILRKIQYLQMQHARLTSGQFADSDSDIEIDVISSHDSESESDNDTEYIDVSSTNSM